MDIQDFVPVGAGSLRARRVIHNGQQAATFSTPELNHDEVWQSALRGGESDPSAEDQGETTQHREARQQRDGGPGRPGTDMGEEFDLQGAARMIRSALRPWG